MLGLSALLLSVSKPSPILFAPLLLPYFLAQSMFKNFLPLEISSLWPPWNGSGNGKVREFGVSATAGQLTEPCGSQVHKM